MVLGSFECWGVLLLLHIVEQGPAELAAGAGRVGYILYIFHLCPFSNVLTFGRLLNMTEILWFRLLVSVVVSYCRGRPRVEGLSKKISNDQELMQSDPTSGPQNQKGNN